MPEPSLKRATWLELFYDLAFVALIAQLTYLVADHHSSTEDWLNILIVGYAIFIAWWGTTANRNLQDSETAFDKVVVQIQMLGAFFMSLTMPAVFAGSYLGFFATLAAMRLLQVFMLKRMYYLHPHLKPHTQNIVQGLTVASGVWAMSAFVPAPFHFVWASAAVVLDVLTPQTTGKGNTPRLLNVSHLQERLGLFLMLVLGESMLVVALANTATSLELQQPLLVFAGVLLVIAVWWLYFEHLERCAKGVRPRNLFLYLQAHGWLFGSIILMAASFKTMLKHGTPTTPDLWLYGAGFIGTLVALGVIRYTLHGVSTRAMWTLGLATVVSVAALSLIGFWLQQLLAALIATVVILLTIAALDVYWKTYAHTNRSKMLSNP